MSVDINFAKKDSRNTIEMLINQFKKTHLSDFVHGEVKVDFDLLTHKNNHQVSVRGLKKHQSILQDITRALEKFINDEIAKCKEPPTQKITTECLETLKMNF